MDWIHGHFDVIETGGIVSSFLIAAYATWKGEKARKIGNLLQVQEGYDHIWGRLLDRPELGRVLSRDADLARHPVTQQEAAFVKMLFIHLGTVYRTRKAGMFVEVESIRADIRDFLALPIPEAVWGKIRPYQNGDFVRFVEKARHADSKD